MLKWISKLIFLRIMGWKITGTVPTDLKKYIMAAAPHTSWMDVPVGLFVRKITGLNIKVLGKHTLFKPPFGWFFRWIGGIPVNRTASHNMVKQVANMFENSDEFAIVIAPEGTRKKVEKLKTGFYYIAKLANVPIVLTRFNFAEKEVHFSEPFYPSENADEDIKDIWNYFVGIKGKKPELSITEARA